MYTPNTMVTLCNTPLTLDNEHQMKFASKIEQSNYFLGCSVLNITDFTFQRKDSVIRVNQNIENLYNCNYVMYQNTRFSLKWFYAYITKLEYVNEQVTFIHIKTDVFQTWFFDLTFNKSFIDRQHPVTDNYNTIADIVNQGQLVKKKAIELTLTGGYFVFCNSDVSKDETSESFPFSFTVGNYNMPCWVIYFPYYASENLSSFLQKVAAKGRGDRIISCVYIPFLAKRGELVLVNIGADISDVGSFNVCTGVTNSSMSLKDYIYFNWDMGYTHKKTSTYPYSKIMIVDKCTGQNIELAPEKFSSEDITIVIEGSISETPTFRAYPRNYKGDTYNTIDSLIVKCNTTLPTGNNSYAKFLMQNGEAMTNKMIVSGGGAIVATATGDINGMINGLTQVTGIVAQDNAASKLPNQVSSIVDGAMERLCFNNELEVSFWSMDYNHKKVADEFWNMYGYPVHALGTPNLNSRPDYNYVKLVNPNIEGSNVPGEDMIEIENLFTNGITLWHTTYGFRNY